MRGGSLIVFDYTVERCSPIHYRNREIFCRKFDQIHSESRSINTKGIASGPRLIIHDLSS